jgi:hypothetical protein
VEGDLATITRGSDSGLKVGSELTVFRLQPRPEFLGSLKVISVTPREAIGRLQGPKRGQVRTGD